MSFDNPEEVEAIVDGAMRAAITCPDTPIDGGFGYDFEDEAGTATSLIVVPYAGDEKPIPKVVRHVSEFMLTKPV